MARARFVLRYRGEGASPPADVSRVAALPGAVVVDATARMLLVESEPDELRALVDALPGWVLSPEQRYAVPDTRKRAERPPDPDGS